MSEQGIQDTNVICSGSACDQTIGLCGLESGCLGQPGSKGREQQQQHFSLGHTTDAASALPCSAPHLSCGVVQGWGQLSCGCWDQALCGRDAEFLRMLCWA